MNSDACLLFAQSIGIDDAELADNGIGEVWVRGTCPLGWLHATGRDRNPSFGIKVSADSESYWYCFAHGGGTLAGLIHTLTWHRKFFHRKACDILATFENAAEDSFTSPEYNDRFVAHRQSWPAITPVHPKYFDPMFPQVDTTVPSDELHFLVHERKISVKVISMFDIRYWPGESLVVFPVRNPFGDLVAAVTRNIYSKQFRFLTAEWTENPDLDFPSLFTSGNFFGENLVDSGKPVLLVESALEAGTVASYGFQNVIASCGSMNRHQLERLRRYSQVYVGMDDDPPGRKAASKIIKAYKGVIKLRMVRWGDVGITDPGHLESPQQLKDALYHSEIL